ncbi:MAG TPA: OmpA family protein, partial [Longimicrobiales bacterium]
MMRQSLVLMVLMAAVGVGACSRRQPPPEPAQQVDDEAARRAEEERRRREEEERRRREEEERRRAEEEARRAAAEARSILEEMIHFDFDRAEIRADAQATLQRKLGVLRANPGVTLRIEGHADERGSVEYNLALGLRRANAAKDYLVGFGLDASRFEVQTYG